MTINIETTKPAKDWAGVISLGKSQFGTEVKPKLIIASELLVLFQIDRVVDSKQDAEWFIAARCLHRRRRENCSDQKALVLDIDDNSPAPAELLERLPVAAIAHTTISSTPNNLKTRVFIPVPRQHNSDILA